MGYEFESSVRAKPTKWWLWGPIWAVIVFFLYAFWLAITPAGKARSTARETYENCWQEYERKSLSPEQKRIIASVCEKLEADAKRL